MLYFTLHLQCLPACVINVGQIKKRDFNSSVTEGALAKCTYNWILLWKGFKKCLVSECSAVEAGNQRWSDSSQQVFLAGAGKTAEHPEVGLNNPKALHFSNHNRGVICVPVTRRDLDPDWALRRHAIDPHSQESQLPLKPWQWNCTASIGSAAAPPYYL